MKRRRTKRRTKRMKKRMKKKTRKGKRKEKRKGKRKGQGIGPSIFRLSLVHNTEYSTSHLVPDHSQPLRTCLHPLAFKESRLAAAQELSLVWIRQQGLLISPSNQGWHK
jgi:hypothetical protein